MILNLSLTSNQWFRQSSQAEATSRDFDPKPHLQSHPMKRMGVVAAYIRNRIYTKTYEAAGIFLRARWLQHRPGDNSHFIDFDPNPHLKSVIPTLSLTSNQWFQHRPSPQIKDSDPHHTSNRGFRY